MDTVAMKVVEVESLTDQLETEHQHCSCWLVERYLTWFVILLTVVVICLFSNEVLQLMHLRNQILETELEEHIILHQKTALYRNNPPLWMP